MTRHHPSTIASPGTAEPQQSVRLFLAGRPQSSEARRSIFQTLLALEKIGLTIETSHELFDRLDYQRVNGGDLIYTDDGPKLDDDNEPLFLIWRGQRS